MPAREIPPGHVALAGEPRIEDLDVPIESLDVPIQAFTWADVGERARTEPEPKETA